MIEKFVEQMERQKKEKELEPWNEQPLWWVFDKFMAAASELNTEIKTKKRGPISKVALDAAHAAMVLWHKANDLERSM